MSTILKNKFKKKKTVPLLRLSSKQFMLFRKRITKQAFLKLSQLKYRATGEFPTANFTTDTILDEDTSPSAIEV